MPQRSGSLSWLHAVYFLDADRGWAVGGTGVLLSTTDGGKRWHVEGRPTNDGLRDVYFSDEKTGWLVCERSIYDLKTNDEPRTFLMHTTDGGTTWNKVNIIGNDTDVRLVRALFTAEGRAWAFGEAGTLFTTRDGGANWERQRVPTRNLLLGGSFLNGKQGWLVGTGGTVLQTSDGGATWSTGRLTGLEPVSGFGLALRVRFTAASFVDARLGWAVGTEGRIFATRDGGRTWAPQISNVASDFYDVKFVSPAEGWVVGAGGTLLHTVDGGFRWVLEPSGTTHALERLYFVGRARGWAVGFGGTILAYSSDVPSTQRPSLKQK
jgi:photosystem II stability/assembly factor-like uncharacterized protein